MTTTQTQQPKALQLADRLKERIRQLNNSWNAKWNRSTEEFDLCAKSEDELRRQHAEIARLTDAYCGASEDLAIWKRRALVAEEKLRAESAASSKLVSELNTENGPTYMCEAARQHNPLSYDEVLEAIDKTTMALRANAGYPHAKHIVEIARAIEAAHGIVEKP